MTVGKRTTVAALVVGLGLYVGLWLGAWQNYLPISALRVLIAFGLWLAPGWVMQQLVWKGAGITPSQRLAVSFGVSVALVGGAGFLATALQLSIVFVIGVLVGVGCIGAIALAARQGWQWKENIDWHITPSVAWMALPVAVSVLVVIWLTSRLAAVTDDLTFNGYLANAQFAEHLNWNEIFFGIHTVAPARFWLAYWTLTEALIAQTSGVHGLLLTQYYFSPVLACMGLGVTYALARAFDFSRALSMFAVTAETAALLLLTATDQVGLMFFNRLVEDRVVAVLLLIPIFAITVIAFIGQPTKARAFVMICGGAALVVTHPTIAGLGIGLIGLFALLDFLARRDGHATLIVLGLCALMLAVLLAQRFLQPAYTDKIVFGVDAGLLRQGQLRRIWEWNGSWYAVPLQTIAEIPYVWICAAAILALTQLKDSVTAHWLTVTTLLVVSVVLPFTAPLWSLAIPAAQLWRVPWIAPFGIAAAYLVKRIWERLAPHLSSKQFAAVSLCAPVVGLLLLGGAYGEMVVSRNQENLNTIRLPKLAQGDYRDLIALAPMLRGQLEQPAVLVGGDKWLNDRLPALTANVRLFAFRSARNMWQLGNLTLEQAHVRLADWRALTAEQTAIGQRQEILKRYQASWVVAEKGTGWVEDLLKHAPPTLTLRATQGKLNVYQVMR